MRDYKELSKRLRHCPAGNPSICQLNYEIEEDGVCQGCEIKFEAADAIEELLAAVPHWISVEDRLPETYGSRLVTTQRGALMVCCYYPRAKNWNARATITHWMPLPVPPKEVE